MYLDERKRMILEAVIRDYVETAEPVGSRTIVRKHQLGVSPATVRNEMADLEEMGFLEQPHTSAGRIPSERGFRYYVDCMMEKEQLTPMEIDALQRVISEKINDINEVIRRTSLTLSQLTRYASFIVCAPMNINEIKSVQLVPMRVGKAMVVVVTSAGVILHKRIDIPDSIQPVDLEGISSLFTRNLAGTRFSNLNRTALESMRAELLGKRQLIDNALQALEDLLGHSEEEKVMLSGTLNMFNEPEFKNLEKLRTILGILQEESFFRKALDDCTGSEVKIKIGKENQVEEIKELSLVFTSYEINGEEMGKIGLLGPVRMEYWKAAGSVESVREIVVDVIRQLIR